MLWYIRPVRLVQILAGMDRVRVVPSVPFDCLGSVVCGPENVQTGVAAALCPSAEPGE